MRNPVFKLGLRFATTDLFRKAIRNYSIMNMRMIKFKCNYRERVRAVCVGNFNRVCFASAVNGSEWVQVKKLVDVHDCGIVDHNFHANSTWLAQRYATQLSRLHNWDMGTFKQQVQKDLSVIASKSQIYRARQKATSITEGTYEKQYELLWDYAAELRRTNMGNTVIIKCHHFGQLLSAVGVDPNNNMYPIAYAVAEVENYETWSWFCQLLAKDLGIENNTGYVFITHKQKRLD
ncbi:uncharacterized protein LOC117617073 [Prunus dulcis]|uniref:uncharacterized protein LOC117617073 n=1 Tax=Prunus dulcis TaxID=3755 RepID=UPI0014826714|nr:uncharacterized protein LOC117617073 [Prunus dulcis]